ncbi:MAG: putative manganese transporter [Chloroflexota bacterium]
MEFGEFILENLEEAGFIGGYVAISIIGIALITFALKGRFKSSAQVGPKWAQPIIGALLGVIPGCGGTIVVSTMYKNNQVTFGALLAAFIATVGEGSFVLLGASDEADVARNLTAFAIVNAVGFVMGITLGYGADAFGFRVDAEAMPEKVWTGQNQKPNNVFAHRFVEGVGFYTILAMAIFLAPGSIMELWGGEIEAISDFTVWVTIAFAVIGIIYYLIYKFVLSEDCCATDSDNVRSTLLNSVADLSMVILYVFIGLFVANFIIEVLVGAERFEAWMTSSAFAVVLIAALIGVTPGCGGMIAVAAAFVTIPNFPIAALIAAGIATSGDGIFPLIAQNRKDAVIVSVDGLAAALVVGYLVLALGI